MWKYDNKYIQFLWCCYSGFFCDILSLNVKMYLWLKLYTVPIFVSGQTYKISKGSNNYCSYCKCQAFTINSVVTARWSEELQYRIGRQSELWNNQGSEPMRLRRKCIQSWSKILAYTDNVPLLPEKCCNYKCFWIHILIYCIGKTQQIWEKKATMFDHRDRVLFFEGFISFSVNSTIMYFTKKLYFGFICPDDVHHDDVLPEFWLPQVSFGKL